MRQANRCKQLVKRYKKAPPNKTTNCLFFTTKTPSPLSLVASNKSSILPFFSLFENCAQNSSLSSLPLLLNEENVDHEVQLIEIFISDQCQSQHQWINQFVIQFRDEAFCANVRNFVLAGAKNLSDVSVNAAFTIAPTVVGKSYDKCAVASASQELLSSTNVTTTKGDHLIELSDPSQVPGLIVIRDFITEEQEALLLEHIAQQVNYDDHLKTRQVKHYGFEFDYNTRRINPLKPIEPLPEWTKELCHKIAKESSLSIPDQLTINEYLPGQGIKPHIDTHSPFEDGICSLSLLSDLVMNFTNPETGERRHVLLERRSLLVMTGESRYLWRHGIHCRKRDELSDGRVLNRSKRLSMTFRKIRTPIVVASQDLEKQQQQPASSSGAVISTEAADIAKMFPPCTCQWPKYCDSQSDSSLVFLPYKTDIKPSVLENEFVVKFYDTVAVHWDHTRHSPWPSVTKFICGQPQGSLFADVGCGNGKYIKVIKEHNCYYVASDRSEKLVELCSEKYGYDVKVADATYLPYRSNAFDAVINIAVMHHISSYARRLQLLRELIRICRPGGQVLVVAWALEQGEQERKKFEKQDTMVPWHFQSRFNKAQSSSNDEQQAQTTTGNNNNATQKAPDSETVLQRYCHVYKQGELEELLSHIEGCRIISSEFERGNWNITIEKLNLE